MAQQHSSADTPQWSSRFAFLMAAVGSAVGLGNLWRFPFQTGQNGGSAFVLVYLLCVLFIVFPILMAELSVGRHKGLSAVGSTRQLAKDVGKSGGWSIAGWAGVLGAFFILTTYSVVAGRVIAYSIMSFMGEFSGTDPTSTATVATSLYNGNTHALLWHTLFMAVTIFVVSRGVKGGIEKVVTVLMPMFFFMLFGLCIFALMTGAAGKAFTYLFTPRFSELNPQIILAALGQAFFSTGVGSAVMITYGSFLSKDENISSSAGLIAGADTLVAIIAGLMIFPIVFAFGLDPAAGMSLIFNALPAVFAGMPVGAIVGGLFFFLAFIAALTSSISLLLAVSATGEDQFGLGRTQSAVIFGVIVWTFGTVSVLIPSFAGWFDFLSGSVFLPLGGFLIAVFAGWVVPRAVMRHELSNASDGMFRFWRLFIRYLAPIVVAVIFVLGIDAKFNLGLNAFITGLTG